MLARTYKSAAELGRTQEEVDALLTALDYLGKSDIPVYRGGLINRTQLPAGDAFDMRLYVQRHDCGTVACLAGWANILSENKVFSGLWIQSFMQSLFLLEHKDLELAYLFSGDWQTREVAEACTALNDYLTTGEARWGGKRYFESENFKRQMDYMRNGARQFYLVGTGNDAA